MVFGRSLRDTHLRASAEGGCGPHDSKSRSRRKSRYRGHFLQTKNSGSLLQAAGTDY